MAKPITLHLSALLGLTLAASSAVCEELVSSEDCSVDDPSALPGALRIFCASIDGLEGRDLLKARLRASLSQTNQPPVARLEVFDRVGEGNHIRPTHVDLDASGSFDEDGFVERFTFLLFDAETNEVLAGPEFTREPLAALRFSRELPPRLRATVTVEDDAGRTDTTAINVAGPDTTCTQTTLFSCSLTGDTTECQPTAANTKFTSADLLAAAQTCDARINMNTTMRIAGWGGGGGRGGNFTFSKGGAGGESGLAALGTSLADLDNSVIGPGTEYCYGTGRQGWFHGTNSGSGGASTLLFVCEDVSEILIAGGGGGGGAGTPEDDGGDGGAGGVAFSTTTGDCGGLDNELCGAGDTAIADGGQGGRGGIAGQFDGMSGVGGLGGAAVKGNAGPAAWTQGNPQTLIGIEGAGGSNESEGGGAGGGGFGGGGSGGGTNTAQLGGGGGGSYAQQSTRSFDQPGRSGSLPGSLGFFFTP